MIDRTVPRYHFDRGAGYRLTVRDDTGDVQTYRVGAYQGWLSGPDGVHHRFGVGRRERTELRDDRITSSVGPLPDRDGPGAGTARRDHAGGAPPPPARGVS